MTEAIKTESLKTTSIIFGAVLFNSIFWNEKLGVNAVLFTVFIVCCLVYFYPHSIKKSACKWLLISHLVTAAIVVFQNTLLSKVAFSITMLLFVAFSQYKHRSVWFAGCSAVMNYVFAIPNFFRQFKKYGNNVELSGFIKLIRKMVLPLLIVAGFVIVYALANVVFSDTIFRITNAVGNWIAHIFDWLSVQRIEFFLLGILITCGLLLAVRNNWLSETDMQKSDNLPRKKGNFKKWKESAFSDLLSVITGKSPAGVLALKNEFSTGLISLVLLNVLLLFVNVIDIKYVWLGYKFQSNQRLFAYVHEGAGLLILSIILAMLLLLFFFRGNLNFYKRNNSLKRFAYLWIFQNSFLVFSVFIRDYYYIFHCGLAYKRIGLLFFLAMVLIGLLTVFSKIYFIKSTYYLLRINAWAAIILLVFASAIDWDVAIATYNIERKSKLPLDVHFLLSLSDKTLPIIEKNKDILENKLEGRITALEFFENRKKTFMREQASYSWLSWNASDAYVTKVLKSSPAILSLK
jgi:hypothetical protein